MNARQPSYFVFNNIVTIIVIFIVIMAIIVIILIEGVVL